MTRTTRFTCIALLGAVALNSGCASMSNTDKGVLTGGAIGAGAGALLAGRGKSGVGAIVGGLAGAAVGGLTGHAIDKSEQKQREIAAANANPPLSLEDVARLTASGTSDDVIINQICATGSIYHLGADHILWLQQNGVREPVIRAMQQTTYRPVRRVYVEGPAPVYVVPAPPPPPFAVGIGFGRR